MSNSFATLTIVGNLGRDPELRYTPQGTPVTTINVGVNREYKNAQEQSVKETTWFRCTVWGKMAEVCKQYLVKGNKVGILGRLTPDSSGNPRVWDKQDGTKGASFEVHVEQIHFLSGGNGNGAAAEGEEEATTEIPF
jgi:single-strand DNA-binding protein